MKKTHALGLATLSGVLLSLAWPENGWPPLLFIAFVPLFYLQQESFNARTRKNNPHLFFFVYLSFFIWNASTTYWIWNSTAAGALMAIVLNTLFMTLVFQAFSFIKRALYDNRKGWFVFISFWLSWEFFHMNWDLTWPWLNLGNAFATLPGWIQWYEFTGALGGTLWVILPNIIFLHAIRLLKNGFRKAALVRVILAAAFIFIPIFLSQQILRNYHFDGELTEVVVVQPNIDPYSEQYSLPSHEVIRRNLNLAEGVISPNTQFVVCPESAIQEQIWENNMETSRGLKQLRAWLEKHPQISLIIGASTFSRLGTDEKPTDAARKFRDTSLYYYAYNTAFNLDTSWSLQRSHKSKLTPGVEKMPSWGILGPLEDYAIDLGGTIGTLMIDEERHVFTRVNREAAVAPVICYESVYGEFVGGFIRNGANLIFVITNDGWWGDTPGHRQHLYFSVLRAIETRRDIARSANTGISCFISQTGEIYQATPYWEPAVIKQSLFTNKKLTFYTKYGDFLGRVSYFVTAIFLLTGLVRRIIHKP